MYTPLGIKTDYSLLKSLIKIEDLLSYAKQKGLTSLGILDDNLCGSHLFYEKCHNMGIKPIIGLDLTVDGYNLYLYPQNYAGLQNLFRFTRYQLENITSLKDLKNYRDNVICVLPLASKELYSLLKETYTHVFIAFQNAEEEVNAKLVTDDIVYIAPITALTKESSRYVNYLTMIEKNQHLGDIELKDYQDQVLTIKDYNTDILTDLIDISFPTGKRYIPHFSDSILDSEAYLRQLAMKGLTKRLNGVVPPKYVTRLNYELSVIANMGFTDYFLIVLDYVRFAIKNNIYVGCGRGSAVGSLVAYSLGITWIDPLAYDLLFERFLNPERVTMPDIDIDFDANRRDEVVEYVKTRYGVNRVARILAYSTMTTKEVLRAVGKINRADETLLNRLLKIVNSKESLANNQTPEVKALLAKEPLLNKIYEESFYLEGLKNHIGTHAAGVIICSEDLANIIPIIKSGDEYLTGYTMNELEALGLLKMDFLSIKNLTIMANILADIKRYTGKEININAIPYDDQEVLKLFARGDTVGIFQFESAGLKNFLKRLKPTSLDDLIMAIAIFRPGPMQNIDTYIRRKNNLEPIKYIDESLVPILKSTYGILIYQEQIMEILRLMAKYSYAEADIVRRAISKRKADVMESERRNFIERSEANGYSLETATNVFNLIERFAEFGFNKSHSVAYAIFGYQMGYLKVHYREIFYINLLNSNIGSDAKTKEYIDEAKARGINILKPDINLSQSNYSEESDGIRLPLRVIKGVGTASSEAIIAARQNALFSDFFDFIARTYGNNVNKKTLEALIMAGVFDSFGYNRATLMKNIDSSLMYGDLIRNLDASLVNKPEMQIIPEYSDIVLMQNELALFGYYVSTHPASRYPEASKLFNIANYFDKVINTVVLVEDIKMTKTKKGEEMAFIKASDETSWADFVAFPNKVNLLFDTKEGDLLKINGRVERRFDKYQIIINNIQKC